MVSLPMIAQRSFIRIAIAACNVGCGFKSAGPGSEPPIVRPFPIRWRLVEDERPGWDDAHDLVELTAVNDDPEAEAFFDNMQHHAGTKIGGYPYDIQHAVGLAEFALQIDSE